MNILHAVVWVVVLAVFALLTASTAKDVARRRKEGKPVKVPVIITLVGFLAVMAGLLHLLSVNPLARWLAAAAATVYMLSWARKWSKKTA